MNSIRMNRKLVSFEAFSSELAERVHRPLLRSKRGKHLSSHDSTSLLVASEVLSYLLHQLDEKGRDVESVLGATSADKLEEVYGILLGEFPDSGLLQERDSRKMKFTKISEAAKILLSHALTTFLLVAGLVPAHLRRPTRKVDTNTGHLSLSGSVPP